VHSGNRIKSGVLGYRSSIVVIQGYIGSIVALG
jgi:hypothetical protein